MLVWIFSSQETTFTAVTEKYVGTLQSGQVFDQAFKTLRLHKRTLRLHKRSFFGQFGKLLICAYISATF